MLKKMSTYIQCLSRISTDVKQPSIYLTSKNGPRYIFGTIGEGLQRLRDRRSFRTNRLTALFLTGTTEWDSVSGLPGLLLCLNSRGVAIDKLYVGDGQLENAQEMVNSWNLFKFHDPIATEPVSEIYEDSNIQVIPLNFAGSSSFILNMKPLRGKFLAKKAIALGVKPGKQFGLLCNKQEVVLENGVVVKPEDVIEEPETPAKVLILDLPTESSLVECLQQLPSHLNKLKKRPATLKSDLEAELHLCYLFLGEELKDLEHILEKFHTMLQCKIVVSHKSLYADPPLFNEFVAYQSKFRAEFPRFFPQFYSKNAETHLDPSLTAKGIEVLSLQHSYVLEHNTKKESVFIPETFPEMEVTDVEPNFIPCASLSEPQVITLGTGASVPTKYRNVISTVVRHRSGSAILDAGEATLNNLTRIYGPRTDEFIDELQLCYISHMHADHHIGMLSIIERFQQIQQQKETKKTLVVAGPKLYINFCKTWLKSVTGVRFVDNNSCLLRYNPDGRVFPDFSVKTCPAIHCASSYNVTIDFFKTDTAQNFRVSYSGDTRPNMEFAKLGSGSDLLIHEATHGDDLTEEALAKKHSTISEAISVAIEMQAKSLVLTHISQRYPRLPDVGSLFDAENPHSMPLCFAFDTMTFGLSDIPELQSMVPKMSELMEAE